MDWRNLPDAPESVKYHGGYDPSDPPDYYNEEDRCYVCGLIDCECPEEEDENEN